MALAQLSSVSAKPRAETVRSPPKPGRHGEDTVQPTNAQATSGDENRSGKETEGRRFESSRAYSPSFPPGCRGNNPPGLTPHSPYILRKTCTIRGPDPC